jgi:hypothetical protein
VAIEVRWRGWDELGLLSSDHCSVRFASRFRVANDPEDIRVEARIGMPTEAFDLPQISVLPLRSLSEIRSTPRRAPNAQDDPIFLAYSRDPHDTQLLP